LQQSVGVVIVGFLLLRHNPVYNRIRERRVIPDVFCKLRIDQAQRKLALLFAGYPRFLGGYRKKGW